MANCVESPQDSYTTRHGVLDKIAVDVAHDSSLSEFLRKFAESWLAADAENKEILRPAWLGLIAKFGLEEVRGDE